MNKKSWVIAASVLLGIIFAVVGYIYATHAAEALPKYFPGYQAGNSLVHVKHSIASFVVAAVFFVYAWFASGPKA